jgi:hypothetical protein
LEILLLVKISLYLCRCCCFVVEVEVVEVVEVAEVAEVEGNEGVFEIRRKYYHTLGLVVVLVFGE